MRSTITPEDRKRYARLREQWTSCFDGITEFVPKPYVWLQWLRLYDDATLEEAFAGTATWLEKALRRGQKIVHLEDVVRYAWGTARNINQSKIDAEALDLPDEGQEITL